jgi:S1-C subfamily serine protease
MNHDSVAGGSGFIVSYKRKLYLVTNYHVLTALEAFDTLWYKKRNHAIPNKLEIYYFDLKTKIRTKIVYELVLEFETPD